MSLSSPQSHYAYLSRFLQSTRHSPSPRTSRREVITPADGQIEFYRWFAGAMAALGVLGAIAIAMALLLTQ
jgi:hypothetical protein